MTPFRLIQIIGARPQIIKSSALFRAVKNGFAEEIELITLHTGQHFDQNMSTVFFQELGISAPDIQLDCGGGSHAQQTAKIMIECQAQFTSVNPDGVLVYGDTNSTLAAALCAYNMSIPVFHVEAGLRSHNLDMPEECNRITTDHLSTLLFCPTDQAVKELTDEGLAPHDGTADFSSPGIISCGDVMYDNSLHYSQQIEIEKSNGITAKEIILATCHRPSNSDDPTIFEGILSTLEEIGRTVAPVILPLHPRVLHHEDILSRYRESKGLQLTEAVSYIEMTRLLKQAKAVITDSGGLQKEAFFLQRPCVVMRDETEWVELVNNGNSVLAGNTPARIKESLQEVLNRAHSYPEFYGNAHAADRICKEILQFASDC